MIDCKKSPPLSGIDVAILVGGLGTRLRGVVDDVPKPFAPVLGRSFVFYILDMLARHGARSVTLCSGYMADIVREKTGNEWHGIPVHHSVETEPLGTAGALANAKEFLKSRRVLVLNGDTWCEPDFKTLLESGSPDDFLIVVVEVPDASRYGTLKIDPSGRRLPEEDPASDNAARFPGLQSHAPNLDDDVLHEDPCGRCFHGRGV